MTRIEELISVSQYSDYPDTLVTLRLCVAMARMDKRNVDQALRACARAIVSKAKHMKLRDQLKVMGTDPDPRVGLAVIAQDFDRLVEALMQALPDLGVGHDMVDEYISRKQ